MCAARPAPSTMDCSAFGVPIPLRLPYLCFRVRLPGCSGKDGASQVLNVSLHPCRALWRPRQTLDALTKACALCRLLRPLTHRRLHSSLNEAVSNFGVCDHPCGLVATLCTLQHGCSVTAQRLCVPVARLVGARGARCPTPRFFLRRSLLQPVYVPPSVLQHSIGVGG